MPKEGYRCEIQTTIRVFLNFVVHEMSAVKNSLSTTYLTYTPDGLFCLYLYVVRNLSLKLTTDQLLDRFTNFAQLQMQSK